MASRARTGRRSSTPTSPPSASCSRRSSRRASVLEDGMATACDIDLGMMAGAGLVPPPFARADQTGLDVVLEQLETADRRLGRALRPAADPAPARRAGAARRQGRPGLLRLRAAGQRRQLRAGRGRQARDARRGRGGVDGPAAGELAVAAGHRGVHPRLWDHADVISNLRALVICLGEPESCGARVRTSRRSRRSTPSPARRCCPTRTRCCAGWSAP